MFSTTLQPYYKMPHYNLYILFVITAAGVVPCGRPKKVQVGNDQEMAQSERNSHSIYQGVGKN